MGHNVGKVADLAVKKGERRNVVETRTNDQILSDIRKNLENRLAVTADDQRFLLSKYDEIHAIMVQGTRLLESCAKTLELQASEISELRLTIRNLNEQIEEFRSVYDLENRSMSVKVERVSEETAPQE